MSEEKKSKWLKLSSMGEGEELTIQFLGKDGQETFSVWDNQVKKFVKDGETINTSMGELPVNKFITLKKLTPEEQLRWRRNPQFVREAIINNENKFITLTPAAEKSLREVMETVTSLKQDPLGHKYILSKTKADSKSFARYSFRIGDAISKEDMDKTRKSVATKEELEVIDAIRTDNIANKRTREEKTKILINNGIKEARAKELAPAYF